MITVIRYSLSRYRGAILGWGIGLAALSLYLVMFYDSILEMKDAMEQFLDIYPKELMALFGGFRDIFTPPGYLHSYFFSYMPLILGIFMIQAGSRIIAGDEESGMLDILLSTPISRTTHFLARFIAFLLALLGILVIIWFGFIMAIPTTSLGITAVEMIYAFLSMFAILSLFGTLALFLSQLLPSRRVASMLGALVLVGSFFILTLSELDENLVDIVKYTPLNYYQGGWAVEGLNIKWFLGLLGVSVLFSLFAWILFLRKDIRVSGDGNWVSPSIFRKSIPKALNE